MHAIHHTEAVIIKSLSSGEANKRVWLFTREFGLVVAAVQGVRKPSAKLAAHLSDYSFINADLVKGKEVWRLIGAQEEFLPLAGAVRTPIARAYVRTLSAVDRFLVDEGPHEELFAHLKEIALLVGDESVDVKAYDALSLWRMLALLGYIAPEEADEALLEGAFAPALSRVTEAVRVRLIAAATDAIAQSHL
jgi:recombinational DNA repair protein (RecF pathway)